MILKALFLGFVLLQDVFCENNDKTRSSRKVIPWSSNHLLIAVADFLPYAEDIAVSVQDYIQETDEPLHPMLRVNFNGTVEGLYDLAIEAGAAQISPQCAVDLVTWYTLLRQNSTFALQLLDAAGKVPSGVFQGALTWPGSFGQCLSLNNDHPKQGTFGVHYCLTELGNSPVVLPSGIAFISIAFHEGLCMPVTCDSDDVDSFVTMALTRLNMTGLGPANTVCQPLAQTLDSKAKIMIAVLVLFGSIMLIGTALDVVIFRPPPTTTTVTLDNDETLILTKNSYDLEESHYVAQLFLAFSVYTNFQKIFNTDTSPGQLGCINGIRFLSMAWVILGHTYIFGVLIFSNILDSLILINGTKEQVISNALLAVDTFFLLSGFLVAYTTIKALLAKDKISPTFWPMHYFHRFWRLTPPYMLILGTYVSLFMYLGSGPWWPVSNPEIDGCRDSWWTNLLYINNVVKDQEMCMAWTWYLANDMQFYVISPIFLYLFYKSKKLGLIAVGAAFVAHVFGTGFLSHYYDLPVNQFSNNFSSEGQSAEDYSKHYYFKPYTRIGPYLVGILLGFLIISIPKLHLNKLYQAVGWVLSAGIALSILYGTAPNYQGHPFNNELRSTYNALHRSAFGCAVGWVIAACVYGYGGPINAFLSFKAWIPLGRLTYCAYLIHPVVMFYRYSSRTTPLRFDHYTMIYMFFGHLVISYALAVVASLAFEVPMLRLEKLLFKRPKKE